jgi:hypothetical protein
MFLAFMSFDLWLHSKSHRTKCDIQLRRLDSDTLWFVALTKEQLASISKNGLHGLSFRFNCFSEELIVWTLKLGGIAAFLIRNSLFLLLTRSLNATPRALTMDHNE